MFPLVTLEVILGLPDVILQRILPIGTNGTILPRGPKSDLATSSAVEREYIYQVVNTSVRLLPCVGGWDPEPTPA